MIFLDKKRSFYLLNFKFFFCLSFYCYIYIYIFYADSCFYDLLDKKLFLNKTKNILFKNLFLEFLSI